MTIIATDKNQTTQSFDDIATLLERLSSKDKWPNIISLDLSYNNIGDKEAIALAKALETNTSITSLHLQFNQIGDEGAKAFAKALEKNTSVTFLKLGSNNIKAEGAKAIAKALETNTRLTSLHLEGNNIKDEGAKAFAKTLKANTNITTLHLYGKSISAYAIIPITHALEGNKERILEEFNWRSLPENMQTEVFKRMLFKNVAECREYAYKYAPDGKDTKFLGQIYDLFTSGECKNADQRASLIEYNNLVSAYDGAAEKYSEDNTAEYQEEMQGKIDALVSFVADHQEFASGMVYSLLDGGETYLAYVAKIYNSLTDRVASELVRDTKEQFTYIPTPEEQGGKETYLEILDIYIKQSSKDIESLFVLLKQFMETGNITATLKVISYYSDANNVCQDGSKFTEAQLEELEQLALDKEDFRDWREFNEAGHLDRLYTSNSEALSDPAEWDWDCPWVAGVPEYKMLFVPASESNEGSPELECAGDVQAQPFTDSFIDQ